MLDLLCACSDRSRRALGGLYRCAKFSWNRYSSFDTMHVFRFCEFGLKTPIYAQKMFFFWGSNPIKRHPKRHILAQVRVVSAIMRENTPTGLTLGEFPEKGV